ncbi:RHS repeat-associated core domain-containing protein [Novosphingobium sp.]|uniref:RHS repeat-associated core domain-containing protein n=1 Tax=Novosphingobium sp. TaxID=1874826 RepID=UPI003B5198E2
MATSPYPFSTTWTGAGNGTSWSDAANWSNGVPLPAAYAPTGDQDLATINNSVATTPFALVIAGNESAGEIDIDLTDPAGAAAVTLTGTLAMSTNVSDAGSGFGLINLAAGTFAIDGGTLTGAEVKINGGALVFRPGTITLGGDIIDGNLVIDNGTTVVMSAFNGAVFDGLGGYGTATDVVISNGSTVSTLGSIYLSGLIDVKSGGTFSFDGGSLNGWGSTGTIFADGGTLNVTHSFSVTANYVFEGAVNFIGADTISINSGDDLALVAPASATSPDVIDLNGGTIDVTGGLTLVNTVLENGTVILESGATYTADATSSISGVTLTDHRPAGQTNWTGGAGDDDWSNAANWTNGVPQSGLGFTTDGQSVAVINNIINTVTSTIVIANDVNAQDIYVGTTDPSNGPSVSLTGTLDTSYAGEGGAYGYLDLTSGTFEIDGGTLAYTGVGLNGGTLAFGSTSAGAEFLHQDIVNGDFTISNSEVLLEGYNVFHGQGGGGPSTVTQNGGSQLIVANGTLALDGTLDIQDGGDSTLFALDGGNLSGYGDDNGANIFIDGGTFAIDASTTFSNTVNIYGGYMVVGNTDAVVTITIDASSVTSIGQAGGAQTVVNLNGANIDVFGTLDLTNTLIENGTITVESGAVFNQDQTDALLNVNVVGGLQTATNWTGQGDGTTWDDAANWDNGVPVAGGPYPTLGSNVTTIDNNHGDSAPFTVTLAGTEVGALVIVDATDPAGGVAARLTGTLDLSFASTGNGSTLGVLDVNGGTFEVDGGTLDVLNVNQLGGHLTFGSAATYGASTLNASGIAGNLAIGNGSDVVIGQYSFGAFNADNAGVINDVTIQDNSELDIKGSLGSSNNIHIVSGSVVLDGGSLSLSNNAKLTSEGGSLSVIGTGTLIGGEYDGAIDIGANNTLIIGGGNTVLLSNPAGQDAVNLDSGTLDVQGTLDVAGIITGAGSLNLETGSKLENATVNAPFAFDEPTVNIAGTTATLDNVTIDATINNTGGAVITIADTVNFGNASDSAPMQVNLDGGTLDVTGTLNLINTQISNGTIKLESGATLTTAAASSLSAVTVERTLANGDTQILGPNVQIQSLQTLAAGQNVGLETGVNGDGTHLAQGGQVTFVDTTGNNVPVGFIGAGTVTVTDGEGLSSTDFSGAALTANVAGNTLAFVTDTYLANGGSFSAENGGSLVIGDAANAGDNLTDGVVNAGFLATGGSSILLYGAKGISVLNGETTIDNTSTIGVSTPGGTVALAQSLTSIGSQDPATGFDKLGILNLNNGASLIDPNAVKLYGTINLAGGTVSTAGLSGDQVVFNSGFGSEYPSGVLGYGTLDGPFGSTGGNIYMEASGGTLTYTGTVTGFVNLIGDANSKLIVNSALDSNGYNNGYDVALKAGSTVDLTGAIGDTTNIYVNFTGSNATLELADTTGINFRNIQIQGAQTNDVIDLDGLVAATNPDGSPNVTITRYVTGSVGVTIVPVGGGAADTFTITNAANTKVTFNPDNGNGGSQILLTADPVITAPGSVAATQGYAAAISGVSLADISLANSGTVTVTVVDVNGVLAATGTGVSGSGTKSLTVTGSLADVNAELATLTVLESGLGNDALAVSAVDSAGNSATTQSLPIYVEPPIVIGAQSTLLAAQNVATPFGGAYVYEQGALNGADLTVTVSDATGILTATGSGVSGSGTHAITLTGSQSAVSAELSALTITEQGAGTDTVTFNATDAAGDKAPTVGVAVTTLPTPSIVAPFGATVTQNSITPLTGFSIDEAGAPSYEQFTVTLSDASGLLSATGSTATGYGATSITLTGSLSQVNSDLATLTVDDPNQGSDTLNLTVTDSLGGTALQHVQVTSNHVDAPDLTVGTITAPQAAVAGQTVQLTWTITNSGDATATGPWTDNVYVASDAAGSNKVLAGTFTYTGSLAPGQSETETHTVTVPGGLSVNSQTGTATTYFVVQADANNQTGSLSGIQNHITVASTPTAATQTINWNAILGPIKPAGLDATDFALFEQRFIAEVGTTDASFATAISNAIATLDKTGTTNAGYTDAVNLLVAQAFGAVGGQQLAKVVDPSQNTSGLNSLLTPSYGSSLTSRNSGGAFGDGWNSEFNDVGPLGPMNGIGAGNVNPESPSYVIEYITTYVDQDGNYLGRSISYQVVAPVSEGIAFLDSSNPYSNYTKTNPNGTIETFDGMSGLVIAISDGHGDAIAIHRNESGVITSITTTAGHPPVFTVNAQGNITSATDTAGNVITYTYDETGAHLLSTTSPAGTTGYQYSTSTNAFIQNALTQVTASDGSTQTYTYDAQGNLASQLANGAAPTIYGYPGANTVTRTNAAGQTTTYTYDELGQPVAITDANGGVITLQHNANGQVTSITSATGQTYGYAYDATGDLTRYTDPLGNTVQDAYGASTTSSPTSVTDQNGNQTQYTFNAAGQTTGVAQANGAQAQYQYNTAGQLTEEIEASGATIQYTYNAAGAITKEAFSDGTSQSYSYDASGNLASATAVDGSVTTYTYTAQGLLSSVTNAAGQVESYSYNAAGQETQRIEPDGSITNYTFTSAGKLAQITDGSGAVIATYTYRADGALTGKITGNGASTAYTYDAAGNMTEIKILASDGTTTSKIDYTYDADGRIATATSGDGAWTYTYDAANQLTHAIFASTNASIANQDLTYKYDAAGNRIQTIFNGATTNYTANNLNQYTAADGTTYGYDANGNLVTKTSGGATTTYNYNIQNQLTSSTDTRGTTTYAYDAFGNIASEMVNGIKTTYVSDPLAINATATGALSAVAQAYNASGQATATYVYGNGLTAVTSGGTTSYYNADASGNITSLSGANGTLTQTYVYSPTGTVLGSTGSVVNPFQFNGLAGAITQTNGLVNTRARYYDPTTGRFISQDPTGQSGGINLYTYSGNNSLNYVDPNGAGFSPSGFLFGVASLAITAAVATAGFVTAPVTATVFGLVGLGTGLYSIGKSLTKDGNGIYVDSPAEVNLNLLNTELSAIPGGPVLSTFQALLSGIGSSDIFDVNYALKYYFGDRTISTTQTVNRPRAGGWGDVHLTTFDGVHFNFQAVGEFLLAKSTAAGDNFQVQIRLSALGGGESAPTLTTEIGIQVGNQTIVFAADRSATVYLDGVPADLNLSNPTLSLAGGTITALSQNSYQVTEKTGEVVNITNNGSYLDYTVDLAPGAKPGSVEGLLGSYSGAANAFQLPDGTALGATLSSDQLYQTFGNAWRITDGTSLLNYLNGETTATYTDLAHPQYDLPVSSLPTAVVQAATAAVAAAGLTGTAAADALYDYLVTGNPSLIANAASDGSQAPVTSSAVITAGAAPPPSIGISPAAPTVTEVSNQTPVTFTISLTGTATANTVVNYAVVPTAIDSGKTYFNAADFGGTLPSGTVTILAGQTTALVTVEVPNAALGAGTDKWLAVAISGTGANPVYASTAQVDVINNVPVAGTAPQPLLEYVLGNAIGATENAPSLAQSGNSYVLDLGNVVQGTAVAALQFALANLADAPADSISAQTVALSGTGFNVASIGSATLVSAGKAITAATVQPLSSTLGAQTTLVTIGTHDVNVTGYNGALPNITLTIKENVVAAAQAVLGTTAIKLADVRVGANDTQTIKVTNSAGPGAAALDVTLSAGSAAVGTGSISQLAAGASDSTSIALGVSTVTAGLQSSAVTLNLASDLGNGASSPLVLNQSVSVTGAVYRAAAATVMQGTTTVHVGDAGSQTLSIANSDPADGYSEGLRATVAGVTGGVTASGTTGLIAAGTTDASSVTVGYSTATSGVVSGQVNLALTSDGTGIDTLAPIAIGTDAVAFSVQVDNYATADLRETSGGGTLTGSAAAGYTLDLGTIAQGSGPATVDLAALNAASGLADLLSGTFGVTANSAFTNSGLDSFSGLGAGQSDGALSASLSTANDGTFSETITLTGTGSNASGYSGSVAPVSLTIKGTVSSETPVLVAGTVVTGAITEAANTTGSATPDTVAGSIAYTDTNLSSTHAASITGVSATGVTTGLPVNSALLALLSLGTLSEDTASNPGSVSWNFAAADSTFDYLAAGEKLTLTYAVQIVEVGGKSVSQDVTVTVTGTNDAPVIAAGTTATASLTANVTTPANDTATGTIAFTDADSDDTHTASVVSVSSGGTVGGLPNNATLLSLLTTSAVTEQAGSTPGSVTWNFNSPDSTFAYLGAGQTVSLTYVVDVTDNHGATVKKDVTVNVTGPAGTVQHHATAGSILGTAYASYDNAYTAGGMLTLQTFYNQAGATVATKSYGAYNSFTVQTFTAGTFAGTAYASHTNTYTAADFVALQTFYDASGDVVATQILTPDGGHTIKVNGVVVEVKTIHTDGTGNYDVLYNGSGSIQGVVYTSQDTVFTAAKVPISRTFAASGKPVLVQTYGAGGAFTVQTFTAGTFAGTAYASHTNSYTAADFVALQTFYDASGNVVATQILTPDGGHTIKVNGVVVEVKTIHTDGTGNYDVLYNGSGSIQGLVYTSQDTVFTAAKVPISRTFAASGKPVLVQTYGAGGAFTVQTFTAGTFAGTAYASHTNSYTAADFVELQTFYDASGNVVGTQSRTPDGGYTNTVNDKTVQDKAFNPDGSYVNAYENQTGRAYTQIEFAVASDGTAIATSEILTSGTNATTVYAPSATLSIVDGIETATSAADTFMFGANTGGTINVTGAANAALTFGFGDGAQMISGYATSTDSLSFKSVFDTYASLMNASQQQGSGVLITLDATGDTVLVANTTKAGLFNSGNIHLI